MNKDENRNKLKGEASKLSKLGKHDCIIGKPEDIVHIDWYNEWNNIFPEKKESKVK